ncbi:hypothetical protein EGW08_003886 [Elysia chlorotica]|uniref:Uncharacterized protein n=1 Tax=Elysia chlorotica TaxID=188477 RepID=A0A433U3I3_ELYCH|nr:hypothetical protein EGW08_003886 [Elysia chlorotica]
MQDITGVENAAYTGAEDDTNDTSSNTDAKSGVESPASSDDQDAPPLAWYFKLSWLLSDIVTPVSPIVTLIFFTAMWSGGTLDIYNANTHAMNSVLVFLDQVISARPIRLLHVVAPIAYGLVYQSFNAVFWSFDHKEHVIYPGVIDWNMPGKTILNVCVIALILVPMSVFLWFLFYRLKLWIHAWRYEPVK